MTQSDPIAWFLHLPPEAILIFAIGAGLLATAILAFFAMKKLPDPESDGESGWTENAKQENFWKKKRDDLKGWT